MTTQSLALALSGAGATESSTEPDWDSGSGRCVSVPSTQYQAVVEPACVTEGGSRVPFEEKSDPVSGPSADHQTRAPVPAGERAAEAAWEAPS